MTGNEEDTKGKHIYIKQGSQFVQKRSHRFAITSNVPKSSVDIAQIALSPSATDAKAESNGKVSVSVLRQSDRV